MGIPIEIVPLEAKHWSWVRDRASPVLCQDTSGIVALKGEKIVGVIVLDSWSYNSCLSHVAIEDPQATRRLVRTACEFVFLHVGAGLMTGLTPADNLQALKFSRGIGFREVYRVRDGYKPGVDYVLQEMRREECRWIRQKLKEAA